MKSKKIKIIASTFFAVLLILIGSSVSEAGSASITASSKSVSVGDSVTVSVSGSAKTWSLKASGDGISGGSIVGGNLSSKENQSFSESYSLDTSKPGTYTISLFGDVTDASGDFSEISDSVTITVAEKSTNNDNNGDNGNSGNGNNNNNNNNNNNTPVEKEPTFSSTNDTVYATGNINVRKSYSTDSDIVGSLEDGEEIKREATGDNGWSKVVYNGATAYIKTSLLTTEKPDDRSSDKALKSLEITPQGLSPEFDPETTSYNLEVGVDIDKLDIKAVPNDEKAKVEISGNDSLKIGENTVKITVTAEDETVRTYTIKVRKQERAKNGLKSLKIEGYKLSPTFSATIYEYKLSISDISIAKLDIEAIAEDENSSVEISGNDNLKNGQNTVIITVKSEDEEEQTIYKIYVTKAPATTTTVGANVNNKGNQKSKMPLFIGIGVIVILIIAIIVVIIKNKRNNDYYEEDDDEYSNENDNLYGYSSRNSNIQENDEIQENNEIQNTQQNKDENTVDNIQKEDQLDYNPYTTTKNIFNDYDEQNEYFDNSNYDYSNDEYKPRRSKGKHSK